MLSNTLDSLSKVLVAVMRVVRPLPTLLPRGGAKGGGGKGEKRDRDVGKRTAYARFPGGMGSGHNGGKPCTNHAHDPTKGGNVRAVCSFSHVHWDAALEPSQAEIAIAVASAK
jgi:hypothetical protein